MLNRFTLIMALLVAVAFELQDTSAKQIETAEDLVYFNEGPLLRVKSAIAAKDPHFLDRYTRFLTKAIRF
jgi:hypothetical protein